MLYSVYNRHGKFVGFELLEEVSYHNDFQERMNRRECKNHRLVDIVQFFTDAMIHTDNSNVDQQLQSLIFSRFSGIEPHFLAKISFLDLYDLCLNLPFIVEWTPNADFFQHT